MNIGSLYHIKKYSWLLFPSKETVHKRVHSWASINDHHLIDDAVDYWSRQLKCNLSCVTEKSMFLLLEQDGNLCKILSTEGNIGWIIYPENEGWTNGCIKEVKR